MHWDLTKASNLVASYSLHVYSACELSCSSELRMKGPIEGKCDAWWIEKLIYFLDHFFFKKAYKPIISTWLAASSNKVMSLSLQSGSCFVRLGFSVWCVCLVLRDRFKEMASFQFSSFPSVFLQLPSGGYFCSWLSCRGWKERSGKVLQSASSL